MPFSSNTPDRPPGPEHKSDPDQGGACAQDHRPARRPIQQISIHPAGNPVRRQQTRASGCGKIQASCSWITRTDASLTAKP